MELLKVGDKVYLKEYHRWGNGVSYTFDEVVRLTKTQAITARERKILNEPGRGMWNRDSEIVYYPTYGDKWKKWAIVTPEILEEAKAERYRVKIDNWFSNHKFTDEEKKIVFEHFTALKLIQEEKKEP